MVGEHYRFRPDFVAHGEPLMTYEWDLSCSVAMLYVALQASIITLSQRMNGVRRFQLHAFSFVPSHAVFFGSSCLRF